MKFDFYSLSGFYRANLVADIKNEHIMIAERVSIQNVKNLELNEARKSEQYATSIQSLTLILLFVIYRW